MGKQYFNLNQFAYEMGGGVSHGEREVLCREVVLRAHLYHERQISWPGQPALPLPERGFGFRGEGDTTVDSAHTG